MKVKFLVDNEGKPLTCISINNWTIEEVKNQFKTGILQEWEFNGEWNLIMEIKF